MLLLLALQMATPADDAFARGAWGRIGRSTALRRDSITVDMRTDGWNAEAGRNEHRFRLTRQRGDELPLVRWADSQTCPAVLEVATLTGLPMPEPQPPGRAGEIVLDGVGYSVTATFGYGSQMGDRMTLRSNVATPLAAWVDGALAKLERCWSPVELHFPS